MRQVHNSILSISFFPSASCPVIFVLMLFAHDFFTTSENLNWLTREVSLNRLHMALALHFTLIDSNPRSLLKSLFILYRTTEPDNSYLNKHVPHLLSPVGL